MTGVSRSVKNGRCWAFLLEPGVKVDGKYSQDVLHCNKCYPLSHMLRVTISSFGRTAHLHIRRVIQSNSCSVKQLISFLQSYGPQQPGPEPHWLQDLGDHAAACVRDADPQCRWTQELMVDVWSGLQQSVVDAAVIEWRKRLQACVHAKGGHFEHLL